MRKSTVFLYLLVLLVSLFIAYFTWTGEKKEERPGKKVTILECSGHDLTSLLVRGSARTVEYVPKKSQVSGDSYWWVSITSKPSGPEKKETDAKKTEEPEGKDASQATQEKAQAKEEKARLEVFKGNKSLKEQIDKLCPLQALRAFGVLNEEKLKEFGIIGSEDRFILGLKNGPREFVFGKTSYGHRDRYLQDLETREVYLVAGQLIQDLNYPKSRFMERALHQFEKDAVVRLQISTGETQKELLHKKQAEQKKDFWTDSKDPDKENQLYGNWVNNLFRLSTADYLPLPEAGTKGCSFPQDAEYFCSFIFFSEATELGFLKIYKGKDEKGEPEYYGCSENTEAVVKLSRSQTENFLKDLDDVMGKP